jgi:cell division protein FtsW
MAFGRGGETGVGLGDGIQKLFYLPEPHTDFIFAVIGEELGLVGTLGVMCLYGILVQRGFAIAGRAPHAFGRLTAQGLTFILGFQALAHMGVNLGLLPTKGLTLPLVSYGGSSLVATMAAVGILISVDLAGREAAMPGRRRAPAVGRPHAAGAAA